MESSLSLADQEKVNLFNLRIQSLRNEDHLSSGSGFSSSAYSTEDDEEGGRQDFPKEDYLGEFVEPDEMTVNKIIAQVEYYFSDGHVHRDSFMQKHIRRGVEGYISIKLLACFRKVKTLTKDYRVVAYSVRKSANLQVNELGTKVKRVIAFPKDLQERGVQVVLMVAKGGEDGVVEEWVRNLIHFLFRKGAGGNNGGVDGGNKTNDNAGNSNDTHVNNDHDGKHATKDGGDDDKPLISDIRILKEWKYIPKIYRDAHSHLFNFHHHHYSILIDLFHPSCLNISLANQIIQQHYANIKSNEYAADKASAADDVSASDDVSVDESSWRAGVVLHPLPSLKPLGVTSRRKTKTGKKMLCTSNSSLDDENRSVNEWKGSKEEDGLKRGDTGRGSDNKSWRSDSARSSPISLRKSVKDANMSCRHSSPSFPSNKQHDESNPSFTHSSPNPSSSNPSKTLTPSPWSTPSSSPRNSPTNHRRKSKLGPSPLLHGGSGRESPRSASPWLKNKHLTSANNSFSPGTSPLATRKFIGEEKVDAMVVKVVRLPRGPEDVAKAFSLKRSRHSDVNQNISFSDNSSIGSNDKSIINNEKATNITNNNHDFKSSVTITKNQSGSDAINGISTGSQMQTKKDSEFNIDLNNNEETKLNNDDLITNNMEVSLSDPLQLTKL